jgi:GH15 family glucan-1,4-alpha-glucosidase
VPGRIEDYALIGDLQTAALVGRDGSIDWLCLPRFDSAACFAALLGDASAGSWRIAPAGAGSATTRRYQDDSLILQTEWQTPEGTVRLIDFMPPRGEAADVIRMVEGVSGAVPMRMDLTLRFDRCDYDGRWPDAVRRSLILLKALTYAPTGGILAAATTSLPEQLGGPRNWDYRYSWLRDATFTLQALLGTGYVAEAKAWRE